MIRSLKFLPRHKYKIATFGVMPTVIYKTYVNALMKRNGDDISINTSQTELLKVNSSDKQSSQISAIDSKTILEQLKWKFKLFMRAVTLIILFMPCILGSPMYLLSPDKWFSLFAYCVEAAGPVFIKLAQYVSQRGDLFSDALSDKF